MKKVLFSTALWVILLVIPCFFSNCSTSSGVAKAEKPEKVYLTLLDRLREVPELTIRGTGIDASITIRGFSSLHGNNEPLFVVNGAPVGHGYASIADSIDVNNVKSIRALPRAQAGIYGNRGANGVIQITTN